MLKIDNNILSIYDYIMTLNNDDFLHLVCGIIALYEQRIGNNICINHVDNGYQVGVYKHE